MYKLAYMVYEDEEGKEVKVRIIEKVREDWWKLVSHLELPDMTVENERAKPYWCAYSACYSVFTRWLSGEGRKPLSWDTVIKALKEIGGYRTFIEEIKHALAAQ